MIRLLHLLQSFVYYHFRERILKPESIVIATEEIEAWNKSIYLSMNQ